MELSALQRRYYQLILAKNYRELNKGVSGSKAALTNIVVQLKKCCNHPLMFEAAQQELEMLSGEASNWHIPQKRLEALVQHSGKMLLLDKLLNRLKETGHRVLIFSKV